MEIRHSFGSLQVRKFRLICIGVVTGVLFIVGCYIVVTQISENCYNTHKLYVSIDKILKETDNRIEGSVRRGSLSRLEATRYHKENERNRMLLKEGDCEQVR